MCYAIPGKLVEINDSIGVVDYFGEKRNVLIDSDVNVGDYVYAQGGVLISKISEEEAREILIYWKDKFFELKEVDKELAKVEDIKASDNLLGLLQKVNLGKDLSKDELLFLLNLKDKDELKLLYETANNVRQKEHDNACCVHGIIEFSNYCNNDCFYCGIRKSKDIQRYRMTIDEIIKAAKEAVNEHGFRALVLQSGEDSWYDDEKLITIVKEIRKLGVLIFLSLGSRSKETYKKLYEAGARAALLRFETSNKELFSKLRPEKDFEERLELIKYLKELGYVIATGFIVGLGETDDDIINNILLTKSFGSDMYSFGPLIPTKGTPLEKEGIVDKEKIKKIIAITRFIDKQSKILVTTALETLDKEAKKEGLLAGANSLMIDITPKEYIQLYSIYDNRAVGGDLTQNIKEVVELLYSIGRAPTDLGV